MLRFLPPGVSRVGRQAPGEGDPPARIGRAGGVRSLRPALRAAASNADWIARNSPTLCLVSNPASFPPRITGRVSHSQVCIVTRAASSICPEFDRTEVPLHHPLDGHVPTVLGQRGDKRATLEHADQLPIARDREVLLCAVEQDVDHRT